MSWLENHQNCPTCRTSLIEGGLMPFPVHSRTVDDDDEVPLHSLFMLPLDVLLGIYISFLPFLKKIIILPDNNRRMTADRRIAPAAVRAERGVGREETAG